MALQRLRIRPKRNKKASRSTNKTFYLCSGRVLFFIFLCAIISPYLFLYLYSYFSSSSTLINDTASVGGGTVNDSSSKTSSQIPFRERHPHFFSQKSNNNNNNENSSTSSSLSQLRRQFHSLLSQKGGYGPHHPRVAVIITGHSLPALHRAIDSVYEYTPRARLLTVVAVLDGVTGEEGEIKKALGQYDSKMRRHFHWGGFHTDTHRAVKLQVILHSQKKGVSESRRQGVDFVSIYCDELEEQGLMDAATEDVLLLFLRQDAALESFDWLEAISERLVSKDDGAKVDKAISLAVDYINRPGDDALPNKKGAGASGGGRTATITQSAPGATPTLTAALQPHWTLLPPSTTSSHYPAPALAGAATAMHLRTFHSFPFAPDAQLYAGAACDIELAFQLWMCAGGIEVVERARVVVDVALGEDENDVISDRAAARLAGVWMSEEYAHEMWRKRIEEEEGDEGIASGESSSITTKEQMAIWAQEVIDDGSITEEDRTKCRSFAWYAETINKNFSKGKKKGVVKLTPKKKGEDHAVPHIVNNEESESIPETTHHTNPKRDTAYKRKIPHPKTPELPHNGRVLTTEQLEILSHAPFVTLSHDNLLLTDADGHRVHPHKGATDAAGTGESYIHDPTALRQNPPPLEFDDANQSLEEACEKRDGNWEMLTKKVTVDLKGAEEGRERVKIFCAVYTTEKNHDRIPPILQTWGQKCDGFMVASTKTDPSLHTVNILHQGPEEYDNIWQKVRSIWSYIYDNYYDDYDFFHIGGDDLYLIVENLRVYLESDTIRHAANGGGPPTPGEEETAQKPLFLGRRFAEGGNRLRFFNSGGSGYTLNKAALKTLVSQFPICHPNLATFAEDVMVADCFRSVGVLPFPTKDDTGGERYMPFTPEDHLYYELPEEEGEEQEQGEQEDPQQSDWYVQYSPDGILLGLDHCSDGSVAFHYVDGGLMKRMHAILYNLCAG